MSDQLYPFLLNEQPVRGRIVRLNASVDTILHQHNYPERISYLMAETLLMAAILSSNLKSGGVFTVQIQSKGALSLLVVDADANGSLRGYAQFDEAADLSLPLSELCADGYLAITLDMGGAQQRYQGVVPLQGESIAESIQHYFTQSQQLMVSCKLAVGQHIELGKTSWVAAGIYIEHVPEDAHASSEDDIWREAKLLLHTLRDDELLDLSLPAPDLLYRLFHEGGVWVYDASEIKAECRCNRGKIESVLKQMRDEELDEMAVNGSIVVDCQFCSRQEIFALRELTVAGS